MGLLSVASRASIWRGYEYYEANKVLSGKQTSECEFEGEVAGSDKNPYHVKIDAQHARKSVCNCPHAEGKRIVCKHQIALFFTVFQNEAECYIAQVEEYERNEARRKQEHYEQIVKYVNSLSKEQLRVALINALVEVEDEDENYRD